MRNVDRPPTPKPLQLNAKKWTRALLKEIRDARKKNRNTKSSFFKKYDTLRVRDALLQMYGKRCCYCEASIADVAGRGQIEHRKPKDRFPKLTFEWSNLHLACPDCNRAKSKKWDSRHEILDAVTDRPITDHLTYEISRIGGVYRTAVPDSKRGETTICHANLNRIGLRDARTAILLGALSVIAELNQLGTSPESVAKREVLKSMVQDEYGSLIEYAHTFRQPVES